MIYILVFIISILCTYLAQKFEKGTPLFWITSVGAILFPAVLAGFRDTGIGTDTEVYGEAIFRKVSAYRYSIRDFLSNYDDEEYLGAEFLYMLLNYIASLFFKDVSVFYFLANFVVVLFVYLTAYDNRHKASMWLVMLFFLFIFYNLSLNVMRQSIAVAMSLYAFKYIERKEWRMSFIWMIIIFNAHSSGIFYALLAFINWMLGMKSRKVAVTIQLSILVSVFLVFKFIDSILELMTLFSDKFIKYALLYSSGSDEVSFGWGTLMMCLFFLVLLILSKNTTIGKQINIYIFHRLLGIAIHLFGLVAVTAIRMSWYINILDCIFIPRVLHSMSYKQKFLSKALTGVIILVLFSVWYFTIIVRNNGETYPYKSRILGLY